MDLNRSMVNLYKQKSAAIRKGKSVPKIQSPKEKPPKMDADLEFQVPKITFDELYGCEYFKGQILKIVHRFKRVIEGQAQKTGWPILVCGSNGIGKTSLVEAASNFANLKLVTIPLVKLAKQTRNKFEDSLEHLVRHCIANQPAVVLIDDLERVSAKEEFKDLIGDAINCLLEGQHKLLIFCTTSSTLDSVADLDFSYYIHLKRPSLEARYQILEALRDKNKNLASLSNDCLESLALNTPSFLPRDLRKMFDMAETESDGQPNMAHCDTAVELVKQSFRRGTHLIGEKPPVTWKDIGGLSEIRQAFLNILRQTRRKGRSCKFAGIALYGPPGCGKTMVAQAMANEAGYNFISIKPAELVDKFLGETEKNIRRVFHEAREHEPCMIYFDEFDGLCGTRGNKDHVTGAITTLLTEMDGFISRGQSIILASTNRLEDIDPAMKRPGRLTKHIYVGPPDEKDRRDILDVATSKAWIKLADDVDLNELAKETDKLTGAELDFLVAEAESKATSELTTNDTPGNEEIVLRREHFCFALNKIRISNKVLDNKTGSAKRLKLE